MPGVLCHGQSTPSRQRAPRTNVPVQGTFGRAARAVRPDCGGGVERELAIIAVPAADAGWRAVRVPGVAGRWRGISAGGTGDLLDLVPDDGTHDLVRQRRGGSAPLSVACQCPAALSGSRSRLNRRVLGCQKIFADTAAARSAPHTTSPTTAASRRPVPAPPAWPAGTPPAAAHPGPATTPPRRRRSPSGHPWSPTPDCRRTPQAWPPCPAARSIRVSPGGAGVPVVRERADEAGAGSGGGHGVARAHVHGLLG